VDDLSQGRASVLTGGKEKLDGPGRRQNGASQKTQKQWNEAKKSLKAKGSHVFELRKTSQK